MKNKKFKHVILLYNPASTNSKRLDRVVRELEQLFPKEIISLVTTSKKGRAENQKLLLAHKAKFGPDTLICIAAGDGTVNLVIETLLINSSLSKRMKTTPILPLWGGNANDLGHMLNGYPFYGAARRAVGKGRIRSINPLRVTLTHKGATKTKIGACYASFGATAFAANRINKPTHRRKPLTGIFGARLLAEINTVMRAFLAAPTFQIKEGRKEMTVFEYSIINGSRMAKIGLMPMKLNQNAFYIAKVRNKNPAALFSVLRRIGKRKFGKVTSKPHKFYVMDNTWLQIDGEVIKINKNTEIKIQINPAPFYALSTRLKN